jgi:hypothetical protein
MSEFASQPPSQKAAPVGTFFRGGMMPAAPSKNVGLIVFDLRSLNLPVAEGQAIEKELREHLFKELDKRGLTKNRSAIDLSNTVFGIAIE